MRMIGFNLSGQLVQLTKSSSEGYHGDDFLRVDRFIQEMERNRWTKKALHMQNTGAFA